MLGTWRYWINQPQVLPERHDVRILCSERNVSVTDWQVIITKLINKSSFCGILSFSRFEGLWSLKAIFRDMSFSVVLFRQWRETVPSVLWHCWLGIRKSIQPVKVEWWDVGVVICLEQGAYCLYVVQLMPLHSKTSSSLASFKSRLVLPFLYRLTQVSWKGGR